MVSCIIISWVWPFRTGSDTPNNNDTHTVYTVQHPISYEVGMTEKIPRSLCGSLNSVIIGLSIQHILKADRQAACVLLYHAHIAYQWARHLSIIEVCVSAADEMRRSEISFSGVLTAAVRSESRGSYADCSAPAPALGWGEGCCPRLKILPSHPRQGWPGCHASCEHCPGLRWPCETCHRASRGHSSLSVGAVAHWCCELSLPTTATTPQTRNFARSCSDSCC